MDTEASVGGPEFRDSFRLFLQQPKPVVPFLPRKTASAAACDEGSGLKLLAVPSAVRCEEGGSAETISGFVQTCRELWEAWDSVTFFMSSS